MRAWVFSSPHSDRKASRSRSRIYCSLTHWARVRSSAAHHIRQLARDVMVILANIPALLEHATRRSASRRACRGLARKSFPAQAACNRPRPCAGPPSWPRSADGRGSSRPGPPGQGCSFAALPRRWWPPWPARSGETPAARMGDASAFSVFIAGLMTRRMISFVPPPAGMTPAPNSTRPI